MRTTRPLGLSIHRLTLVSISQDLMIYAEHTEVTKRQETMTLTAQLRNAQFDYEDSVNSRRELQARIKELESQLSFVGRDNTVLKHRNPYVLVLIDGNGLIVRCLPHQDAWKKGR